MQRIRIKTNSTYKIMPGVLSDIALEQYEYSGAAIQGPQRRDRTKIKDFLGPCTTHFVRHCDDHFHFLSVALNFMGASIDGLEEYSNSILIIDKNVHIVFIVIHN